MLKQTLNRKFYDFETVIGHKSHGVVRYIEAGGYRQMNGSNLESVIASLPVNLDAELLSPSNAFTCIAADLKGLSYVESYTSQPAFRPAVSSFTRKRWKIPVKPVDLVIRPYTESRKPKFNEPKYVRSVSEEANRQLKGRLQGNESLAYLNHRLAILEARIARTRRKHYNEARIAFVLKIKVWQDLEIRRRKKYDDGIALLLRVNSERSLRYERALSRYYQHASKPLVGFKRDPWTKSKYGSGSGEHPYFRGIFSFGRTRPLPPSKQFIVQPVIGDYGSQELMGVYPVWQLLGSIQQPSPLYIEGSVNDDLVKTDLHNAVALLRSTLDRASVHEILDRRIISQVANQDFNILSNLAEGHQLIDLIKTMYARLFTHLSWRGVLAELAALRTKTSVELSNKYLEWHFGVSPLIKDISAALQKLAEVTPDDRVRVVATAKVLGKDIGVDALPGIIRVRRVQFFRSVSKTNTLLAQIGASDINQALWEVEPYSFIVDWLIPIGTILSDIDILSGLTYAGGTTSYRYNDVVQFNELPPSDEVSIARLLSGPARIKMRSVRYEPPDIGSVAQLKNPVSFVHGLVSLSLLRQLSFSILHH